MTYQELTPAEKGILAATIDRYKGWSEDAQIFACKEEIIGNNMATKDEAYDIAADALAEQKKPWSFIEVLNNEETKKLVEAIEHGSWDKELIQDLKNQLFEITGFKM